MADKAASYSIKVESNAKDIGVEGAAALQQLKERMQQSVEVTKYLSASLRNLKGTSDEVKTAKQQLAAQLEAEKGKITQGTLALAKYGTSFEQLAAKEKVAQAALERFRKEQEKKAEDAKRAAIEKLEKSLTAAGGPVGELREKVKGLGAAFSTSAGATALAIGAIGVIVGVALKAASAIAEAAKSLAEWILESANAARSASLLREAWTGSASNATHLGHQIDALAKKVPLAKEKLAELSGEIVKAFSGTAVSGQGIVDTFNAVAQASAAMGDQAGAKLRELIERGKQWGRVSIGLFDLQGTGIKQKDVAGELAKRLKIGVQQAQLALLTGRVKVDDAAAALRAAVEKRFGKINVERMLDLDVLRQKFKETTEALTRDVNLRPLLEDLQKIGNLFDTSTVTGQQLKRIITFIGNALGSGFGGQQDSLRRIFLYGEIAALRVLISIKKLDLQLQGLFGKDYKSQIANWGLGNAESQLRGLADIIERTSGETQKMISFMGDLADKVSEAAGTITKAWTGFEDLGAKVIDGLVAGIRAGIDRVTSAVGDLATKVKDTFKGALGIHSPSSVFEKYGEQTDEGYERGATKRSKNVQAAVDRMAPEAPRGGGGKPAPAKGGGGKPAPRAMPLKIEVHIHAGNASAKELESPSFLRGLTKAIEDALTANGLPMQTEPQS